MKTMTIDVPQNGAWVRLDHRGAAPSCQVVIVANDDVEVRYGAPVPTAGTAATPANVDTHFIGKTPLDLDGVSASLLKLGTKKRATAINAIKTMFQFTSPITAEAANEILENLRKRGDLSISPAGAIEFPNRKAPSFR